MGSCSTDVVARNAVPPHVRQFTIINVDIDSPYAILVWAFTNKDQEPARVELWPLGEWRAMSVRNVV